MKDYVASNVLVIHSANSTEQIVKKLTVLQVLDPNQEPPRIQDRIVTTLADFFDKAVWAG